MRRQADALTKRRRQNLCPIANLRDKAPEKSVFTMISFDERGSCSEKLGGVIFGGTCAPPA